MHPSEINVYLRNASGRESKYFLILEAFLLSWTSSIIQRRNKMLKEKEQIEGIKTWEYLKGFNAMPLLLEIWHPLVRYELLFLPLHKMNILFSKSFSTLLSDIKGEERGCSFFFFWGWGGCRIRIYYSQGKERGLVQASSPACFSPLEGCFAKMCSQNVISLDAVCC